MEPWIERGLFAYQVLLYSSIMEELKLRKCVNKVTCCALYFRKNGLEKAHQPFVATAVLLSCTIRCYPIRSTAVV